MATRCQNCERTFGWMPRRFWSPTWRCACGVTTYHTFPSFIEVWIRLAVIVGLALGGMSFCVLDSRGSIPPLSVGGKTVWVLGLAATIAMGSLSIFIPTAILTASRVGVPCFLGDMIRAAISMIVLIGCCGMLIWIMSGAIRRSTEPDNGIRGAANSPTGRK